MYTVYIPVMMRKEFPSGLTLNELKRAGCKNVFLSLGRHFIDTPAGKRIDVHIYESELKKTILEYSDEGIECGIWLGETMGHGGADNNKYAYTLFRSLGSESTCGFCAADELFIEDVSEWARIAANAGAKIILLDDDYRMHSHGLDFYAGCLCEKHVKRYCDEIGECLTAEEIRDRVFTGGGNRYRDAWVKIMDHDMMHLAERIREKVDSVNPECRIGLCLAPSAVNIDCYDFTAICDVLAGKTRPFVRLIGAPYWAQNGAELASEQSGTSVIILARSRERYARS